MPRPDYSSEPQAGTRLYNGRTLRKFNTQLAEVVERALAKRRFPLVVGGDCSILLGALVAARRDGPCALVHIDGHSDFRHPGNYDPATTLGAVAGMDLALATGRGEPIASQWPGIEGPLVRDEDVVQIGERESRDSDFAWPDVADTAMTRIEVFEAREIGGARVVDKTLESLAGHGPDRFWLHCDIDVLDETIMSAVDSPGSPGIDPDDLATILRALAARPTCIGMTLTVYDPDLDPDGRCADVIVDVMRQAFGRRAASRS